MKRITRSVLAVGVFAGISAITAGAASAQSVAVDVGTFGIGGEVGFDITDVFAVRAVGNYFALSHSVDGSSVHYDGHLRLFSLGLLGDAYLFNSGFRVTGGAYVDRNRANIDATPTSAVTIGNSSYTPAQVGKLSGRIRYKEIAPYLGLGYTSNHTGPGFRFSTDIGAMYQGGSTVALSGTGLLASDPNFNADLARERAKIKKDADDLKFYPQIKVGVGYRF